MKSFFLELLENAKVTKLNYMNKYETYYADSISHNDIVYKIFAGYNEESRKLTGGFRKFESDAPEPDFPNFILDSDLIYYAFLKLYKQYYKNSPSQILNKHYLDISTIYSMSVDKLYIISEFEHETRYYQKIGDDDSCHNQTTKVYSIIYKGEKIRCPLIEMYLPRNCEINRNSFRVFKRDKNTVNKTNEKVEIELTGKLRSFLYPCKNH